MAIFDTGTALARTADVALSSINQTIGNRDEVQARAAEAKLRKNTANSANDPDLIDTKLAALEAESKKTIANQNRRATTDAFRLYIKTGNPIHLTKWLQDNEVSRQQFLGIARIENLDPEVDMRLLTDNGIKIEDFREIRHLKAIMPDGTVHLFDAFDVAVGTGAMLDLLSEEADLANKWLKATGKDGTGLKGELYHNAQAVASLLPDETEQSAMQALFDKKKSGILAGKEKEADKALEGLVGEFGGFEGFYATDFGIVENQRKAASWLRKYKRFGGQDLTTQQQTDIVNLGKLVGLAQTVGEKLTPEVTGIYDTFLRNIKKYISDNVAEVDQVSAQSAYEAFRGMFRHALAGTALTDNEITLFNNTYGTISQKYPAVAAQFMTMLNEVKFKLETIQQLQDPILAHYYLGSKVSNVRSILSSINERIELISQAQGNEPGQFANRTREGVGDNLVVTPNPDPNVQDTNAQDPNGQKLIFQSNEEITNRLNKIWGPN